ncbi:thiamine phosphate synthase [Ammoniphilus sp. CFH 90114]|uniref:thiamine phosphate synthase n=1 Tax=Ammoniphilus sp. CFH 90114 TaxID=2493665 RepID=UPI00100E1294|nr:thiamine phosphate synthase [Ammoniphilus sp. CFH 90114]RXT15230.1 thiamine phosphate synthase [Ammoniphilus sp. CFH 90114]
MNKSKRLKQWDVYLVMDLQGHGPFNALELARQAIDGGIKVIQIREKNMGNPDYLRLALPIRELCKTKQVDFIINDRIDLALRLQADGVHLGQDDIPEGAIRDEIGEDMILGISASSTDEARRGIRVGADYLGVGAIYPTFSKSDAGDAVSPSLIQDIRHFSDLPIVGIGGIQLGRATPVIVAGGNAVAVISAICQAPSPVEAARKLQVEVREAKQRVTD